MLSRPRIGAVVLAAGLLLAQGVPALADDGGGVVCPPRELDCDVTAQDPGKPGGRPGNPGDDVGKPSCVIDGRVACSTEMGVFSSADSCYWKVMDPPPQLPAGFSTGAPDSWKPGDPGGALFMVTCPCAAGDEIRGGIRWSATGLYFVGAR
ncbi:hypothetical protein [Streptomyces sp. H27-S2]|uniref:hypothetical protein n=1 Tax=Streptomyces antarcticus TaxID=2996458 RepID=UPI00226D97D3|nr:hypothetical protein [Streptomyces sp. H27-S2]MCY0954112.1 hypothetical protein [Streptomyces sp. H27-S2]